MRVIPSLCLVAFVLALPQQAAARDGDHDRLPDRWERQQGLSTAKKSANGDPDRDQVDNRNELRQGTKPRDRDTDNDRRSDGREDRDRDGLSNAAEDLTGNDPRLRDTDGDGLTDGKEAVGVVTSFDAGVLTIELARGGTVSVLVTKDTEIECDTEDNLEAGYVGPVQDAKRGRRGRRGRRARGATAETAQSGLGEEEDEPLEEDEDLDDEVDENEDDEDLDDESLDEDEELEPTSCSAGPGARVHDVEVVFTVAGIELEYISLVR